MRRNGIIAGIMLAAVLSLTACSNSNKSTEDKETPQISQEAEAVSIDVDEVMEQILAKEELTMMECNDEILKNHYGLDSTSVKSFAYQMPMMNVNSTEYLIVEAVSEEAVQTIVSGINSRLSYLEGMWSSYVQAQYELVKNSKMLIQGNYVFFFITENADYAENVFLRAFDSSIPELVMKQKYQQITGILTKYSDTEIVVTFTDEEGNEVTVNGTPFESIYVEGEFAVGDEVNIALENRMEIADDHTIDAVISYIGALPLE